MDAIPFVDLKTQYARLKADIDARIHKVLDHGQYINGPEVAEFERKCADHVGARHCVGVSSGTDALLIALMARGVGPGDAVFLPGFTYTATAEVVLLIGATPVFVDVDPDTFNLDPADLDRQIAATARAGALKPRMVVVVDLFGLPGAYAAIEAVAGGHGVEVLADAAQSMGGAVGGRRVGTLAPMTATSFFPAKPLGCYGDGGAIFTDDDATAEILRSIRAHGQGRSKYDVARVGVNGRLDTIQAAVLIPKLALLDEERAARERLSRRYDRRLGNHVKVPARPDGCVYAWAQYTIQIDDRDRVQAALKEAGIPTMVYYPRPMHLQSAYLRHGGGEGSLPTSEALCGRVLSLPMHPYMDDETADRICDTLIAALGAA
ncbi:MAG: DegT/DnrJ/EryC1/StrS family aminotransferase [Rhodospirillales bacterium]|nr:MAG: DegT/DnrJ/EryC1/StrS family aminotransferase [Rhodospirillales bacterium]